MTQVWSLGDDRIIRNFDIAQSGIESQQWSVVDNLTFYQAGNRRERFRPISKNVRRELQGLEKDSQDWAHNELMNHYREGVATVYGSGEYEVGRREQSQLAKIQDQYMNNMKAAIKYANNDTQRFSRDIKQVDAWRLSNAWLQKHGVKAAMYKDGRKMNLSAYAEMQTQTAAQRAYNLGVVNACQKAKIKWMEVSDSSSCGWAFHDDTEKANGKIVSYSEGRKYLVSHPFCVRKFIPRKDLKDKDVKQGHGMVGDVIAAWAVREAVSRAIPIAFKALFVIEDEVIDPDWVEKIHMIDSLDSHMGMFYRNIYNRLSRMWQPEIPGGGKVIPFHEPPPILPLSAEAAGGLGDFLQREFHLRYGDLLAFEEMPEVPVASVRKWEEDVLKWADPFLSRRINLDILPDWVKRSIAATNTSSDEEVDQLFLKFGQWVQLKRERQAVAEAGTVVVNFIAKKKHWNEYFIMQQWELLQSSVRATWTKWGPRTTIDLTDFFRGRITFTKKGVRKSITLNPSRATKTMLGLTQDGTLIGALRFVPNRLFRAIIEVDEFGYLGGNIRLVPNMPFRLMLRFRTPRPEDWLIHGFIPGEDFVDLTARGRSIASRSMPWVHDISRLSRDDFLTKWGDDPDWVSFSKVLKESMENEEFFDQFSTSVAAWLEDEVSDEFAESIDGRNLTRDQKMVMLWLGLVKDRITEKKTLYVGEWLNPSSVGVRSRERLLEHLEEYYEKGNRIDDLWFARANASRKVAEKASRVADEPRAIGVILELVDSRGIPLGVIDPDSTDWMVGGSFVVVDTKFVKSSNRFLVKLEYLGEQVNEALAGRRFGIRDFTFGDIYGTLKQMQIQDVVVEVDLFHKSIVDIGAELNIPIEHLRLYIRNMIQRGLLEYNPDMGTYLGKLQYPAPPSIYQFLKLQSQKQQIWGQISFSQYLPKLLGFLEPKASWAVHYSYGQFQEIIANLRLAGLNRYLGQMSRVEIGHILEIPLEGWKAFSDSVDATVLRMKLFLLRNQRPAISFAGLDIPSGKLFANPIYRPQDITDILEDRMQTVLRRPDVGNRADAFKHVVDAVQGESRRNIYDIVLDKDGTVVSRKVIRRSADVTGLSYRILRDLAGIETTDSRDIIEMKLQEVIFFLKAATIDSDDIRMSLEEIDDITIHLAATQMEKPRISGLHMDANPYDPAQMWGQLTGTGDIPEPAWLRPQTIDEPTIISRYSRTALHPDIDPDLAFPYKPDEDAPYTVPFSPTKYPELFADAVQVLNMHHDLFPGSAPLRFRLEEQGGGIIARYDPFEMAILIDPAWAQHWTDELWMAPQRRRGFSIENVGASILAHEMGHHLDVQNMFETRPRLLLFWEERMGEKFTREVFQLMDTKELTDDNELLASAISHSLTWPSHRVPEYLYLIAQFHLQEYQDVRAAPHLFSRWLSILKAPGIVAPDMFAVMDALEHRGTVAFEALTGALEKFRLVYDMVSKPTWQRMVAWELRERGFHHDEIGALLGISNEDIIHWLVYDLNTTVAILRREGFEVVDALKHINPSMELIRTRGETILSQSTHMEKFFPANHPDRFTPEIIKFLETNLRRWRELYPEVTLPQEETLGELVRFLNEVARAVYSPDDHVEIRMWGAGLVSFLRDGVYKTLNTSDISEVPTSILGSWQGWIGGGDFNAFLEEYTRAQRLKYAEMFREGVIPDAADLAEWRIVHGYVRTQNLPQEDEIIDNYGDVRVRLKERIKDRTTITVGDSLDTDDVIPSRFDHPTWGALPRDMDWTSPGSLSDIVPYIEAQIHGGISLDDIHSIVIPEGIATDTSDATMDWWIQFAELYPDLKRRGVKVYIEPTMNRELRSAIMPRPTGQYTAFWDEDPSLWSFEGFLGRRTNPELSEMFQVLAEEEVAQVFEVTTDEQFWKDLWTLSREDMATKWEDNSTYQQFAHIAERIFESGFLIYGDLSERFIRLTEEMIAHPGIIPDLLPMSLADVTAGAISDIDAMLLIVLFEKASPLDFSLWRGLTLELDEISAEEMFKPGSIFTQRGLGSASERRSVSESFTWPYGEGQRTPVLLQIEGATTVPTLKGIRSVGEISANQAYAEHLISGKFEVIESHWEIIEQQVFGRPRRQEDFLRVLVVTIRQVKRAGGQPI